MDSTSSLVNCLLHNLVGTGFVHAVKLSDCVRKFYCMRKKANAEFKSMQLTIVIGIKDKGF